MSDYTKLTNFAVKDGYTTGNPAKVIKGTELDDEFNAIATAVATKVDSTDVIPVATGGTGSTTAADARTALSAAKSGANSDITSITGLTTALSVAQGGTGVTTLTANNVLLGNGTSAIQAVAPGSAGNVLTSNGTTWASSALPSPIGVSQTWQNMTSSRALGSSNTYTNNTGKPIQVNVTTVVSASAGDRGIKLYVSGVLVAFNGSFVASSSGTTYQFASAIVPAGATYYAETTGIGGSLENWAELR